MKIMVNAAGCGQLLRGSGYRHRQVVEGSEEDAFRIARHLFGTGANVLVGHPVVPLLMLGDDGSRTEVPKEQFIVVHVIEVNWLELGGMTPPVLCGM